jgi:hypothetical protein
MRVRSFPLFSFAYSHGQPRHDRLISRCCAYSMASVWMLLCLSACSPGPADHQVRDSISAYFKAGNIQVVRLEIRTIEREPIGARQYMGPKRYIVHIPIITLQSTRQGGKPVDYQNVTITIRKNTASLYGVSIDNVSIEPWQ